VTGAAPLEVRHVARRFGRHAVLLDATLSVGRGELVAVTGENGAGKTTLLRVIAGLLRPHAGTVRRTGRLGYCPQEPLVFDRLRVAENFRYFAVAYGMADWRAAMARWTERLRFPGAERRLAGTLSGGTRQKLNLALALMHEPDLLLLDEPYAAFDWETYLGFWTLADALRAAGCAILVVSHFVYDHTRCDRVVALRDGVLACP
jgi:ABC-2 type transport system ATP-binding protein